jgi:4-hydroxy-3-polyprenylbenzoate decarboxylase
MKLAVAITGASGVVYGLRLIKVLEQKGLKPICMVSDAARKIIAIETKGALNELKGCYKEGEIEASVASGSFRLDGMVIIPCSMKTLSAVANGHASTLITRAADVMIKEGRRLVIVPRETPLSSIHLENMLRLSRIGVTILPAMPAFYHLPNKIEDLEDFIVGKVLDALGIDNDLYRRWDDRP